MPMFTLRGDEIPPELKEFLDKNMDKGALDAMHGTTNPPIKYNGVVGDSCDCVACSWRRKENGPDLTLDSENEVTEAEALAVIETHKNDPEGDPLDMIEFVIKQKTTNLIQCADDTLTAVEKLKAIIVKGKGNPNGAMDPMDLFDSITLVLNIRKGLKYLDIDVPDMKKLIAESLDDLRGAQAKGG